MTRSNTNTAAGVLAEVIRATRSGGTDGSLLEAFVARRDEAAFAELLRRHGPMVLGVCLRVLRHRQDAEDAFQATFLVLAQKAGSVSPPDLVGNWLHGVALQTAIRARAKDMKRRVRETVLPILPEVPDSEAGWDDVSAVLDEELGRLPEHYRAVVILCDVEGRTRVDAAAHLGCPEGSVSSRLSRARAMLAQRLTRRGVSLAAGAVGLLVAQNAATAVPAALLQATVCAVSCAVAGAALGGVVPSAVTSLAEGVTRTMLVTKLKAATLAALMVALLGTITIAGFGLAGDGTVAERTTRPAVPPAGAKPRPAAAKSTTPRAEHDAAEALTRMHAEIERDAAGFVIGVRLHPEGGWLDQALPHLKAFARLQRLAFHSSNAQSDSFRALGSLPTLSEIELQAPFAVGGPRNDLWAVQCPPLAWDKLPRIRTVRLSGVGIGDAQLEEVARATWVENIHLNGIRASQKGFASLRNIKSLEMLLVQSSRIADDCVEAISGIQTLNSLTLGHNDLGRNAFSALAGMSELRYLSLESTKASDDDIAHVASLSKLADLDLGYNRAITDAALNHLVGNKALVNLRLWETKVTAAGVAGLMKALPGLKAEGVPGLDRPVGDPPGPVSWGKASDGVRVGFAVAGAGEFVVAFENVGTDGTLLNLGVMLGNGKKLYPSALSLTASSLGPLPKHALQSHRFDFASPRIAGRADPYLVPLRPGGTYTLRLTLGDFLLKGSQDGSRLMPGSRLPFAVEFVGKEAGSTGTQTDGLNVSTCWTGTIRSGSALLTLPQK